MTITYKNNFIINPFTLTRRDTDELAYFDSETEAARATYADASRSMEKGKIDEWYSPEKSDLYEGHSFYGFMVKDDDGNEKRKFYLFKK